MKFRDPFPTLQGFSPAAFIAAASPHLETQPNILTSKAAAIRAAAEKEIDRARQIADKAGEGEADLADRDMRRIEKLRATAEELMTWADELEKAETEMRQPQARASEHAPTREGPIRDGGRFMGRAEAKPGTFARLFGAPRAAAFKSPAEYLQVLVSGRHDPRLAPQASSREEIGGSGGFLVPHELFADILDESFGQEMIRPLARVYPMTSKTLDVVVPDRLTRTGGKLSGLAGEWLGEGEPRTKQTPAFRNLSLTAQKCAIYAQASIEIEQDAANFVSTLTEVMAESMAFTFDSAFLTGNGSGQPLGILNAPNVITSPKVAGQTLDTLTYANLVGMVARLSPGAWRRAVWIASQTVLPQLFRLVHEATDDAGVAIDGEAVAAPGFTVGPDGAFLLLGRPLMISEHMPQLGDAGDILLADLREYAIGLRAEAYLERSNAPGWSTGMINFRLIARVDGAPRAGKSETPVQGLTVSPFVILQTRA